MRRNGPWAFMFLVLLAVGLAYWLGPRPVYDLWEARRVSRDALGAPSCQPWGLELLGELAAANGIDARGLPDLSDGDRMGDIDSDGDLDLLRPEVLGGSSSGPGGSTELRPRLYLNDEGSFRDVTTLMGPAFEAPRAVARVRSGPDLDVVDLDGDRKLDVILYSADDSAWVLHNRLADRHALVVRLHLERGGSEAPEGGSGRGAGLGRLELATEGSVQVRLFGASSSDGAGTVSLHFGLGAESRVERLRVSWPSGSVTERRGLAADQTLEIHEREESGNNKEEGTWNR